MLFHLYLPSIHRSSRAKSYRVLLFCLYTAFKRTAPRSTSRLNFFVWVSYTPVSKVPRCCGDKGRRFVFVISKAVAADNFDREGAVDGVEGSCMALTTLATTECLVFCKMQDTIGGGCTSIRFDLCLKIEIVLEKVSLSLVWVIVLKSRIFYDKLQSSISDTMML